MTLNKQWWATGFVPDIQDFRSVTSDELAQISGIDFTGNPEMLTAPKTVILTGCEELPFMQIGRQAKKIMKCIANKDEDGLFGYFAQEIKTGRKEETMKEIDKALDTLIDGNIVSRIKMNAYAYKHCPE